MNNNAIAYTRDSTKFQEASKPEQLKAIEKYAKEHGLTIVRYFEDDGISGRSAEKRPGFMAMSDYVENADDFKYVLVYDCSRFSRLDDPDEATYWEVCFRKHGKIVKYATDEMANQNTMMGRLSRKIKHEQNSQYSMDLSKTSFRGHRHYAELGYHVGGGKKYGYARLLLGEDGKPVKVLADGEHKATKQQRVKLVIGDPEQVKVIRRIYDLYVNKGLGIAKICKALNAEGILSPRGGKWRKSTIWSILHDEIYIGWVIWNRHVYKNLHEQDRGWGKYKPKEEWIICKNAHEAIIEEAVFNVVKAKTRQAYKGGSKYRLNGGGNSHYTPYLLSGIIKCKECDGNYQGRLATRKTKKKTYETRYYICGTYTMKEDCVKWNIPKDLVEDFAIEQIKRRLNDPFWVKAIKERLEKKIGVIKNSGTNDMEKIDAELKEIHNQINNLTDAVSKGFDRDIAIAKMNDLKAKRERLADMRAQYDKEVSVGTNIVETVNRILSQVQSFDKEFPKAGIPTKKMWLSMFIQEIRVDPVEKKCYYYFKIVPELQGGTMAEKQREFGSNRALTTNLTQVAIITC